MLYLYTDFATFLPVDQLGPSSTAHRTAACEVAYFTVEGSGERLHLQISFYFESTYANALCETPLRMINTFSNTALPQHPP